MDDETAKLLMANRHAQITAMGDQFECVFLYQPLPWKGCTISGTSAMIYLVEREFEKN